MLLIFLLIEWTNPTLNIWLPVTGDQKVLSHSIDDILLETFVTLSNFLLLCQLLWTFTKNTSLVAPGAPSHRLQRRTACNTKPPAISKMAEGSRNRSNHRLLDPPINFCYISFLIRSFLIWEPQKSKLAIRGPQRGLESGLPLGFWALPSTK